MSVKSCSENIWKISRSISDLHRNPTFKLQVVKLWIGWIHITIIIIRYHKTSKISSRAYIFQTFLRIQWGLIFAIVIRSRLRLWVGFFIYFKFTPFCFKAGLILNDLYDTTCMTLQSVFKFLRRLRYHISCSYQVHKRCSYRLFSLQEFKEKWLKSNYSSSNYCTNFREKTSQEKGKK